MNPQVEVAVLETARGGILREGLGFDRCDIAVVTNIGEGDHLGQSDIQTLEQLSKVKRAIVEAMAPTGAAVLNAEDPMVVDMAKYCPGKVVFFAKNGSHPLIVQRRNEGARVAFIRDNAVALAEDLRAQVEAQGIVHPLSPFGVLTITIGVATLLANANGGPLDLLNAADRALYRAKNAGRNRIGAQGDARLEPSRVLSGSPKNI